MTKEQVEKLMGKAAQSTDTLWQYAYDDGTSVEVVFSKDRRVIKVLSYHR